MEMQDWTACLGCVLNMAHLHTNLVFVSGVAAFDECPKAPTFLRIMFVTSEISDALRRKRLALWMTTVPIRLVF